MGKKREVIHLAAFPPFANEKVGNLPWILAISSITTSSTNESKNVNILYFLETNNFRRFFTLHKPKSNHCPPSSLVQIDNKAGMLNGLLHSNNYEGRRVTCGIEVLSTTPPSALLPNLGKRNHKSSFTF
ncbi:hypothetical protein TNCV_4063131 [Trichonephila clavipes]|nr:hypothetical protein TNCV_4063131 [Trichonephila clavipes]